MSDTFERDGVYFDYDGGLYYGGYTGEQVDLMAALSLVAGARLLALTERNPTNLADGPLYSLHQLDRVRGHLERRLLAT